MLDYMHCAVLRDRAVVVCCCAYWILLSTVSFMPDHEYHHASPMLGRGAVQVFAEVGHYLVDAMLKAGEAVLGTRRLPEKLFPMIEMYVQVPLGHAKGGFGVNGSVGIPLMGFETYSFTDDLGGFIAALALLR